MICSIKKRFRGFLPVIVDVETTGTNPYQHGLLEMCVVLIQMDETGNYFPSQTFAEHILPFEGAALDPESLAFNKIDPYYPLRFAVDEHQALKNLFAPIKEAVKAAQCQRAVLVGHNAWFDLLFVKNAAERSKLKLPFHAFTCFDTATLSALCYGQTVLAKALKEANIHFDPTQAHSAIYDAEKTAALFCTILNHYQGKILNKAT